MIQPTRKLAVIMFTDIAEFTALSARDEEAAFQLLQHQRAVLRPIVTHHGGTWLREVGDGLLLTFPLVSSAVRCAIEMQQATQNIPELRLRIGIHEGEITEYEGEVLGDDVNVAARIEAFAAPGGVAVSGKVQQDISSLPEFATRYLGQPQLKGVRQEVKVYCVTSHGLPETDLSSVAAKLEPGERMGEVLGEAGVRAGPGLPEGPLWRQPMTVVAMIVLALSLGGGLIWFLKPSPKPEPRLRTFTLPIEFNVWELAGPVLSPDGTRVASTKGAPPNTTLWIHDLAQGTSRELPGTKDAQRPFWSSDSRTVGYFENIGSGRTTLRTVSAQGGPPTLVCDLPPGSSSPRGAAWLPDGRIVFAATSFTADPGSGALYAVPAAGGTLELFLTPDSTRGEWGLIYPCRLPDGTLVVSLTTKDGAGTLVALEGARRVELVRHLGQVLACPAYSPSGYLVYQRGFGGGNPVPTSLWAVPLRVSGAAPAAAPFLVADGAQMPSVSQDGTLLYSTLAAASMTRLVWVDRAGAVLDTLSRPQRGMGDPALSPDGRRVAVSASEQGNFDIWVHDVERGTATRLTSDPAIDFIPVWSPDGTRIAFYSERSGEGGLYVRPADGTGPETRLYGGPGWQWPTDWSADGRFLLFSSTDAGNWDHWYLPLAGAQRAVRLTKTPFNERWPVLSPDGQYVAYQSDESGRFEVYVTAFPSGAGKWLVSVNGGLFPRWSPKGDELFYVEGNRLMAVPVRTAPAFAVTGPAQPLFAGEQVMPRLRLDVWQNYDVSRDGRRFVMVQQVAAEAPDRPTITVVQDWAAAYVKRK